MTQLFLSGLEVTFNVSAVLHVTIVSLVALYTLNRGRCLLEIKVILFKGALYKLDCVIHTDAS